MCPDCKMMKSKSLSLSNTSDYYRVLKKKRGQRGFQQKQGYQSHHQPREHQNKNQSKHGYKEKNEDAPPKKRYREGRVLLIQSRMRECQIKKVSTNKERIRQRG